MKCSLATESIERVGNLRHVDFIQNYSVLVRGGAKNLPMEGLELPLGGLND